MRIAAVGDLHCRADTRRNIAVALRGVDQEAEVLLLAGDLTDHGTAEEANWLAEELGQVKMEKCAVLGNHDYESGQDAAVRKILCDSGVHVLDGEPWSLNDLGVAGVKGFAGGFDQAQLQRFGEDALKVFVDACITEELKLEKALFQLRTRHRIALLHYAPCRQTLEGEPLEIFPFLGATRLGGPLDQLRPAVAFHGHAHRGTLRGATRGGVPVYNVALPVLRRLEKPVGYLTLDL
ncbi:MAG TPA: metallophosphoesterase [Myxococcales bacterium]|jgi:Icc-related predicted phosphoesterase|nr:metallophosphoesterase [Myxococcales bacterium]